MTTFPVGSVTLSMPSNFYVDPCDTTKGLWEPPLGPTVDDFVTALQNVPGYQVSTTQDITWLGYPGKLLEETGPASVADCSDGFAHAWETKYNETAEYLFDGQRQRVYVVDVDGTRVVVLLTDSIDVPHSPGTDPASPAEQQQVFDSIRIAPAPSPTASASSSPGP